MEAYRLFIHLVITTMIIVKIIQAQASATQLITLIMTNA